MDEEHSDEASVARFIERVRSGAGRRGTNASDGWGLPPAIERIVAVNGSGTVFELLERPGGTRQREYEALLPPDGYAIEVDAGGKRRRVGGAELRVGWPRQLEIQLTDAE